MCWARRSFRCCVADDLKTMDEALFRPEPIGLAAAGGPP